MNFEHIYVTLVYCMKCREFVYDVNGSWDFCRQRSTQVLVTRVWADLKGDENYGDYDIINDLSRPW